MVQRQAYVNLSDEEADALPGVRNGTDVVAFYVRFGPGSAVKFFNANRCLPWHAWLLRPALEHVLIILISVFASASGHNPPHVHAQG